MNLARDSGIWHRHCTLGNNGMPSDADALKWMHIAIVWTNITPVTEDEKINSLKVSIYDHLDNQMHQKYMKCTYIPFPTRRTNRFNSHLSDQSLPTLLICMGLYSNFFDFIFTRLSSMESSSIVGKISMRPEPTHQQNP